MMLSINGFFPLFFKNFMHYAFFIGPDEINAPSIIFIILDIYEMSINAHISFNYRVILRKF